MMQCREPNQLGYHKYQCSSHLDQTRVAPHSCKTNICTTCAAIQNDIWSEEIKRIFPATQYLNITFTVPQEFREFFGTIEDAEWQRKSNLAWQTIKGFCRTKNLQNI